MTKEKRTDIQIWTAVGMLVFGVILTIAGFLVPPVGEISDSVLWVLAQSLIYAGSALGITTYVQMKVNDMRNDVERKILNRTKDSNNK